MKKILLGCAKNRWPSQFKATKGKIVTASGYSHAIPTDPMDLRNLIHDIMNGTDRKESLTAITRTRSNTSVTGSIPDDAVYAFARKEANRHGYDENHMNKIASCIFTALFVGDITPEHIHMNGVVITHIDGIDTSIPIIAKSGK